MSADNTTVLPYEKQAMHGDPMPGGLTFPDQVMYQALCLLYTRYRLKSITREQAQMEKRQLLREHETIKYKWGMADHWVAAIKATDLARCEYRKNRTIENADKLVECIDGII